MNLDALANDEMLALCGKSYPEMAEHFKLTYFVDVGDSSVLGMQYEVLETLASGSAEFPILNGLRTSFDHVTR